MTLQWRRNEQEKGDDPSYHLPHSPPPSRCEIFYHLPTCDLAGNALFFQWELHLPHELNGCYTQNKCPDLAELVQDAGFPFSGFGYSCLVTAGTMRPQCIALLVVRKKTSLHPTHGLIHVIDKSPLRFIAVHIFTPNSFSLVYKLSELQRAHTALTLENCSPISVILFFPLLLCMLLRQRAAASL